MTLHLAAAEQGLLVLLARAQGAADGCPLRGLGADGCPRCATLPAVRRILDVHGDDHVVLVGHGSAWTLLVAELTGHDPDLVRWSSLGMPDVITVPARLR